MAVGFASVGHFTIGPMTGGKGLSGRGAFAASREALYIHITSQKPKGGWPRRSSLSCDP